MIFITPGQIQCTAIFDLGAGCAKSYDRGGTCDCQIFRHNRATAMAGYPKRRNLVKGFNELPFALGENGLQGARGA
jgi:hypothetical protein